jgi:hypothetical protein
MGGLPSQQVAMAAENLTTSGERERERDRERVGAVHLQQRNDDLVRNMVVTWVGQWSIIARCGATGQSTGTCEAWTTGNWHRCHRE